MAFCPPGKADLGQEAKFDSNIAKQGLDDWLIAEGPMLVKMTLVLLHRAAQIVYEQVTEAQLAKQFASQNQASPGPFARAGLGYLERGVLAIGR